MRRIVTLFLLLIGMQLVLPLGPSGESKEALLAFGFLLLAAYTVGELSMAIRVPRIVGYMIAGVLFGPSVGAILSAAAIDQLAPVSTLAIALIAFLAGAELRWKEVRDRLRVILVILGTEMAIGFVALVAALLLLRPWIPFMATMPWSTTLAFAMLIASVLVVHSPAVTMAMLSETGARGPVARTTLGVVLFVDVVVILLFAGTFAFARAAAPPGGEAVAHGAGTIAWEIGGAVLIGAIFGAAIALYLRFVKRELFLFAVVIAFFGSEIARLAHVETLLLLLTAGFVTENVSREEDGATLREAMERSALPVYVVFFALAGAAIDIRALVVLAPVVVPIVIVRMVALWGGVRIGARRGGASEAERKYTWMGLVSQAGVAVGLAAIVAEAYPERGEYLRTLVLSVIAINQTIGPILFRQALMRSGELASPETAPPPPRSSAAAATPV